MSKSFLLSSLLLLSAGCGGGSSSPSGQDWDWSTQSTMASAAKALVTSSPDAVAKALVTSSPDAVAKALVEGLIAGDKTALSALFLTEANVKANFDCPKVEDMNKLLKEWSDGKKEVLEAADERPPADMTVSYGGYTQEDEKVIAAGTEKDGCTNKNEVAIVKGKMMLQITKDGETDEDDEGITTIRLGKKYFLIGM
jgi:hypothetical protein